MHWEKSPNNFACVLPGCQNEQYTPKLGEKSKINLEKAGRRN